MQTLKLIAIAFCYVIVGSCLPLIVIAINRELSLWSLFLTTISMIFSILGAYLMSSDMN